MTFDVALGAMIYAGLLGYAFWALIQTRRIGKKRRAADPSSSKRPPA